ncbi:hypothetical protein GIB67_008896 [Kingdonia uniflora]|uniref:Uncharacterized protein n=1 Tax=Kingdonia uniflora TaxID=39325 RepID=A0A7J7LVQ3_9MAGN|nr:hypothetical protein GIB67_008896 [Kingdonia uniflora]
MTATSKTISSGFKMLMETFLIDVHRAEEGPLNVPLLAPFTIASSRLEKVVNVGIRVELSNGCVGWGKAPILPYVTAEDQVIALAKVVEVLRTNMAMTLSAVLNRIVALFAGHEFDSGDNSSPSDGVTPLVSSSSPSFSTPNQDMFVNLRESLVRKGVPREMGVFERLLNSVQKNQVEEIMIEDMNEVERKMYLDIIDSQNRRKSGNGPHEKVAAQIDCGRLKPAGGSMEAGADSFDICLRVCECKSGDCVNKCIIQDRNVEAHSKCLITCINENYLKYGQNSPRGIKVSRNLEEIWSELKSCPFISCNTDTCISEFPNSAERLGVCMRKCHFVTPCADKSNVFDEGSGVNNGKYNADLGEILCLKACKTTCVVNCKIQSRRVEDHAVCKCRCKDDSIEQTNVGPKVAPTVNWASLLAAPTKHTGMDNLSFVEPTISNGKKVMKIKSADYIEPEMKKNNMIVGALYWGKSCLQLPEG